MLASLVRYFLPFALDKYSVLRWQVFRKKEKNVVLWLVSVLSFCYRDLSAWWENRTDQPDMQYHFVITWEVLRHYGSAYLTAVGTMSSAATLGVALECAGQAKTLRRDMVSFGIPLFANIHLCGSVLTEVFFCMVVSQILYGALPSLPTMLLFCVLLGVFAIGAPGVPGGTVMASLGLVTGLLGFDGAGTALVLTVFALQDSFGTACNVTGDGALTLILTGYANRHEVADAMAPADEAFFDGEVAEAAGAGRGKPAGEGAVSRS